MKRHNGNHGWSATTGNFIEPIIQPDPLIEIQFHAGHGKIYARSEWDTLWAIDPATRTQNAIANSPTMLVAGNQLLYNHRGRLVALDRKSGTPIWNHEILPPDESSAMWGLAAAVVAPPKTNRVIAVTLDGRVLAFTPSRTPASRR